MTALHSLQATHCAESVLLQAKRELRMGIETETTRATLNLLDPEGME